MHYLCLHACILAYTSYCQSKMCEQTRNYYSNRAITNSLGRRTVIQLKVSVLFVVFFFIAQKRSISSRWYDFIWCALWRNFIERRRFYTHEMALVHQKNKCLRKKKKTNFEHFKQLNNFLFIFSIFVEPFIQCIKIPCK